MLRKSFDIPEAELARAKRAADRANVSLNEYLRRAVVTSNDGHDNAAAMTELATDMRRQLDDARSESAQTMAALLTTAKRLGELHQLMQADHQELRQHLEANTAEQLAHMKTFLMEALPMALAKGTERPPTPPPGSADWSQPRQAPRARG